MNETMYLGTDCVILWFIVKAVYGVCTHLCRIACMRSFPLLFAPLLLTIVLVPLLHHCPPVVLVHGRARFGKLPLSTKKQSL